MTDGRWPRYPEYRDSGVEWLGEVPGHWAVERAKFLYQRIQRPVDEDDDVVTAFRDGTVTLRSNRRTEGYTFAIKEIGYQGVRVGDLVIHAMDGFAGAIGVSDSSGKCSPVCLVCLPSGTEVVSEYYAAALRNMAHTGYISALSKGIRERSTDFRFSEFKEQCLPVPPRSEQRAIATFLDHQTARIDTLIAKMERLLELLEEKRTALITRAVTKGLDPDVPMKDSGVEWLGEVPGHWELTRWRNCCQITEGQVDPTTEENADRILVAPNHIESGTGKILELETAFEQGAISGKYEVRAGDLIYSKIRPALRKACISYGAWLCSADMYPVRTDPRVLSVTFLLNYVLSEPFSRFMIDESMRVAMPKVNRDTLADTPIPLPPIAEQRAITTYLDHQTARIDTLRGKITTAIAHLREYRTALISAAVTGKIDVRDFVLPDPDVLADAAATDGSPTTPLEHTRAITWETSA